MTATNPTQTGRIVEKELFIAAAPVRVFEAFTTQADLEQWFARSARIELRPGGAFILEWDPGQQADGAIVAVDAPRRLVFTWREKDPAGLTTIEVTFEPEADGTLLRLRHSGIGDSADWDGYYTGVSGGWTFELGNLRQWVEHGTPKNWNAHAELS
jgi:uncharacterized protein YndB with AHSA1/START domain